MHWDNPWFAAAVLAVIGLFHLELISTLLNLANFGKPVPEPLRDLFKAEDVQRAAEYAGTSARVDLLRSATMVAMLIGFWWTGGFGWLDAWLRSFGHGTVVTGLVLLGLLTLVQGALSLPFDLWDTFVVEAEFGFNQTTLSTFIGDRVKGLALLAGIGTPVAALLLWFFDSQPLAALWAWLSMAAFSLIMTWASPRWIMPLFLKFQPLEEGPLRQAIFSLAAKLDFPVKDVSIVDGSRRSTKANAFFTGIGRTRRIALFDTLLKDHDQREILAILAHEIGHCKKRHVPIHLGASLFEMGLMFVSLHFALNSTGLYQAFGVQVPSTGMGMVLFSILYQPVSTVLGLFSQKLSRRHEFEADAFAASAMGEPASLSTALKKLSHDHLSHPMPHPLTVWLHYSHPPVAERLEALSCTDGHCRGRKSLAPSGGA